MTTSPWSEDEEEHVRILASERRGFAWVLHRYGGRTKAQAGAEAVEFYAYEPADKPYRGLVFHDEAWHWAMGRVFGDSYHRDRPELAAPPGEYKRYMAL
ncbi:hypothetical protein ACFC0D_07530 [Streptomyces sp. NPDC056222]|uniref:hypothetical protein n=1 Tax=Streptomyces sp. NPDC056222 TaxID=3345749 RepID=UPI0035DD3EFB